MFETTECSNITVEKVYLNGERVKEEDVEITLDGVSGNALTVE